MILRKDNIARRLRRAVYSVQGKTGDVTLQAADVDAQTARKDNLGATTDPTEHNDSSQGYTALSKWMNKTTGKMYTCLNSTTGNAVWKTEDTSISISDLGSAAFKNIGIADTEVPLISTVKSLIPIPLTKASLGLEHVDNTADIDKPLSTSQAKAIQDAADILKTSIEAEIKSSVGAIDYSAILNTPTLFSGSYTDLKDKPTLFDGNYLSLTHTPKLFDGKYSSLTEVPNLFDGSWTSLTDKPALFNGKFTSLTDVPSFFDGEYSSLKNAPVLFSGSYTDLKDKPLLFDGKYASLSGLPTLFNGTYAALTGKPSLFDGNYNSLSNLPILFSGSWQDLKDKPALFSGSYTDLSNKPALFDGRYASLSGVPLLFDGTWNSLTGKPVLFSGSYMDLTNKPALFDGKYNSLSGLPVLFSGNYSDLIGKPTLFSGSYTDLTNKPTIPSTTKQITEDTNLYYTDARVQTYLTSKGIKGTKYFDAVTDANSLWTLDVSAFFSSVDFVIPNALSPMAGAVPLITEARTAHLITMASPAAIKGSVTKSNQITTALLTLGAPGLTLAGAGSVVKVKVEGTLK